MRYTLPMGLTIETDDSRGVQRVVNYVGSVGAAALISLDGELIHCSNANALGRLEDAATLVAVDCASDAEAMAGRVVCLAQDGACTYYARVGSSLALLVIIDHGVAPAAVAGRLRQGVAVFDRVRVTRFRGSPGTPGSAQASLSVGRAK
jgi:hypothetical protein